MAEYLADVRGLLLGFYPSQTPVGFSRGWAPFFFPPLGLLLILLVLAQPHERLKVPLRTWGLTVAVVWLAVAPNLFMGVHFNRYLLWAVPSLLVLCAAGLARLTRLLSLVAGAQASVWWDVSVPPGVVPGDDGDEAFHENTLVSLGLSSGLKVTF